MKEGAVSAPKSPCYTAVIIVVIISAVIYPEIMTTDERGETR